MAEINAFVGHSFLPEDEAVVRKFTDFFDQIAKSHHFDWVHATEPRPDEVASKVLDLIEGRNLFIGICTPNERVAKDNKFDSVLFSNRLKIEKENLQTKTSDWIIQEIGLAIGRRMKIIILLQNGVRQPGSLQGNIEYIPFDRDAIEKSFSSILGMITNLQGSGVSAARNNLSEGTASADDHQEQVEHDNEDPNPAWDQRKFEFEYFKAVIFGEPEREKVVSEAWLERFGSDPEAVASWNTSCLLTKTRYTDEDHLSDIKSIAENHSNNPMVQKNLAQAYEHFEDFRRARDHFRISLDKTEGKIERQSALAALASVCQALGDKEAVNATISEMRSMVESPEDEKFLLSTLEELAAWHEDNKMLKLALMERELEIEPADTQKRFQLAYAHSESDNNSLTMYHYEKIPNAQRDPITWNNLGVVYQGYSLPGLSVTAYQAAANQGETLAMSNLAEKLMSAGFLQEAQNELHKAKDIDDAHKNVAQSQVRLNSIPSNEKETKASKLKGATELSKFLSAVGHCIWQTMPSEIGAKWIDKNVSLAVSKDNNRFNAKGSYQRKPTENPFAAAMTGTTEKPVETYNVTVSGRFIGAVLVGEYTSERQGDQIGKKSLFDLLPNKQDFLAIVDSEQHTLRCLVGKELKEFDVRG